MMTRAAAEKSSCGRALLDLDSLSPSQIRGLLNSTRAIEEDDPRQRTRTLAGKTIANLFFEDSTRTRVSFTIAAQRLGAAVVDLTGAGSSVSKGETVADTARTVESMGVDAVVVRHRASGAAALVASAVRCGVINAGDGTHAHPTQGLLDVYTFAEAHDRLDGFDLTGLRLGIVGDIANSRVARSDIGAFTKLGAEVVCIGPATMTPASLGALGCRVERSFDAALPTLDGVQMLRVQFERGSAVESARGYTIRYQLDARRAQLMKADAIVMHPGPMNRGIELSSEVADGERSRIARQVEVGVSVRMATLEAVAIAG